MISALTLIRFSLSPLCPLSLKRTNNDLMVSDSMKSANELSNVPPTIGTPFPPQQEHRFEDTATIPFSILAH